MYQLVLLLFVGALFVAFSLVVAVRASGPEGGAESLVRARQSLTQLQTDLLAVDVVQRFSSADDYEFVASSAPADVNALFRRERKKIMLAWIKQIRRQIYDLLGFHLGAGRFYTQLSVRSELSLALDFGGLLLTCRALQMLVYFAGPLVAPRLVGATAATGLRICAISERALAFLTAPDTPIERSIAS